MHADIAMTADNQNEQSADFTFEGPEKTLEMQCEAGVGAEGGFRVISPQLWDQVLLAAKCEVLEHSHNENADAYLLSESSLFVFPTKILLKTCGTTTILLAIPLILKFAKELGLVINWVSFTRKQFTFPEAQLYPHTSFSSEVAYLQQFFAGHGYVLGPITGDHWYVYVFNGERGRAESGERTLNVMMFGLAPDVAPLFSTGGALALHELEGMEGQEGVQGQEQEQQGVTATTTTTAPLAAAADVDATVAASAEVLRARRLGLECAKQSGISALLPGGVQQHFAFSPCGYSMNGLLYKAYHTIHVTPEAAFSYASFECNLQLRDYTTILRAVLKIFRPRHFTVTLFTDRRGLQQLRRSPFDADTTVLSLRPGRAPFPASPPAPAATAKGGGKGKEEEEEGSSGVKGLPPASPPAAPPAGATAAVPAAAPASPPAAAALESVRADGTVLQRLPPSPTGGGEEGPQVPLLQAGALAAQVPPTPQWLHYERQEACHTQLAGGFLCVMANWRLSASPPQQEDGLQGGQGGNPRRGHRRSLSEEFF